MMSIQAKTLIEFCNNNNHFSDSEDESLEEYDKQPCLDKKDKVVVDQPVVSDKITIIVDYSNISQEMKCEPGWENIEFADLDDVIFDESFTIIKEKTL